MKYLTVITATIFLTGSINANAFGLGDLGKVANIAGSAKSVAGPAAGQDRCGPVPVTSDGLDPIAKAKSMATKKAIEMAINKVTAALGGAEPIGVVSSYCDVDKKLAALEAQSIRLGNYVKSSTEKSLSALTSGKPVTANGYDDTTGDIGKLTKDIKKNTKKTVKTAKKVSSLQADNQALLADAMSDLNASLKPAALLLAHDLALANFIADNPRWALDNIGQAKLFVSQLNLLLAASAAVKNIREATAANENLAMDEHMIELATQDKALALEAKANASLESEGA